MFIYVFNEADRDKMAAAGFVFVCKDEGAGAWIFTDVEGKHSIPAGVESVVSSRMTFIGKKETKRNGGDRHGTENDAAL